MSTSADEAPPSVKYLDGRLRLRNARNRLIVSTTTGIATYAILTKLTSLAWAVRAVAAWDAGALALLSLAWSLVWTADVDCTKRHAARDDPGRTAVWVLVLLSSTVSLFVGTVVLRQAKTLAPESAVLLALLSLGAVIASWSLTHTAYTLRYAHLYYRDDREGEGGLVFPGEEQPDFLDFAYYAFTVGMCFQVSDVTIASRQIRRATLVHSMLSFAYNTAIVALALNLAFGLLG
jgi:uncharacterized membrane protein